MANAGVPEALWVSTIASENPGAVTNPSTMANPVSDPPGFSYGIFQFHNDPNAVDPVYSGSKAAGIMGKALQSLPNNATPQAQLTAIEYAAWPGNDPALIAKENPQRASNLSSILAQEQAAPIAQIYAQAGTTTSIPWQELSPFGGAIAAGQSAGSATQGAVGSAVSNAVNSATSSVQNTVNAAASSLTTTIEHAGVVAAQVAIALAVVAGGFALLSSGDGS